MHDTVIFLQADLFQKDGFSPLAKFVAPAGQKLGPIPETLTAVVMDLASSFTRRNYKKISTDRAHMNVLVLVLAYCSMLVGVTKWATVEGCGGLKDYHRV